MASEPPLGSVNAKLPIVEAAIAEMGRVDILVNNAAATPFVCRVIDAPEKGWNKTLEINVSGPLHLTQAV